MNTKRSFIVFAVLGALLIGGLNVLQVSAWNVTIDKNLSVTPNVISFKTVFPQETLFRPLHIGLSSSFIDSAALDDVEYRIVQKVKPRNEDKTCDGKDYTSGGYDSYNHYGGDGCTDEQSESEYCAAHPTDYTRCYPSLCPYLSKEPDGTPANDKGVPAFHNPNATSSIAYGRLAKSDNDKDDDWTIDLHVPCFRGECAQDWASFVHGANPNVNPDAYILDSSLQHETFGCDLVVEVLSVSYAKAKLIVIKHVINDNGGTATSTQFTMKVTGGSPTPAQFPGKEAPGTEVMINAGNYSVSETGPSGYAASYSSGCSGSISLGQTKTCTVTNNDKPGEIKGKKWEDKNGNGSKDYGEYYLSGWTIYLDLNNNGTKDSGEPSTVTNSSGAYAFTNLNVGTYYVREVLQSGWTQTAPSGGKHTVSLTLGASVTGKDFGNKKEKVVTRTLGFWQTHTNFTSSVFQSKLGGSVNVGTGGHIRTITNLAGNGNSILFGAYYSSISKKTNNQNRAALDQARMQLLQQLVTAKINCAAFSCASSIQTLITSADAAYATGTASQMTTLAGQLDTYNNSGDANAIPASLGSVGSATPATSQARANKVFWDTP